MLDIFAAAGGGGDATTLALIGVVGAVITGMFKLLADNTRALNKVAKSSEKVAAATTKSAKEAKQRNGHLGEQNIKIVELITGQNAALSSLQETGWQNAKANKKTVEILSKSALIAAEDREFLTGGTQIVKEQKVAHQTVEVKSAKPEK